MVDDKLAQDEAQRAATYGAVKSNVKAEVGGEIVSDARAPSDSQAGEIENIAGSMRQRAVHEVVQTEHEVDRGRFVARISQVVDYLFLLVYGLLTIRLFLALFAARADNDFVQFIRSVSDPFYSPFKGIVPSPSTPEGFTLALPIVIALVVYILLHMAINGLLRMLVHRKTEV